MDEFDRTRSIVQKAMALDLIRIVHANPQKTEYTPREIEQLIDEYIEKENEEYGGYSRNDRI